MRRRLLVFASLVGAIAAAVALGLDAESGSTSSSASFGVGGADAFLEHATYTRSAMPATITNQDNAVQFLTHHMKARRSFSAGFDSSHLRYGMTGMVPPSSCMCRLASTAKGASALFLEKLTCRVPRRYWVSTASAVTRPFTPKTQRHVSRLLGEISKLRMVKVAGSSFSCIDGRRPHNEVDATESRSLHAFGGDMGEFLLMIAVLKRHSHGRLYESSVDQMFRAYIDQPIHSSKHRPYFYFHSDIETLNKIASELGYEVMHRNSTFVQPIKGGESIPIIAPPSDGSDPRPEGIQLPFLDFTNPPLEIQELLLESLVKPENQGCTHLRMLMTFPKLYGIPLEVIQWVLRSYFKVLWNKDEIGSKTNGQPLYYKLKFVVSKGEHEERAWLNIRMTRGCDRLGLAGIIPMQCGDGLDPTWSATDAKGEKWLRPTTLPASVEPPQPDVKKAEPSSSVKTRPDEVYQFHPQAVQHRREEFVEIILGRQVTLKFGQVLDELNALADSIESRTKTLLTKNIPEYNVRIV